MKIQEFLEENVLLTIDGDYLNIDLKKIEYKLQLILTPEACVYSEKLVSSVLNKYIIANCGDLTFWQIANRNIIKFAKEFIKNNNLIDKNYTLLKVNRSSVITRDQKWSLFLINLDFRKAIKMLDVASDAPIFDDLKFFK